MADGIWRTDWQIGHLADADAETTPQRATERLQTYQAERRYAARDNTENATRSAIFIGPETAGQRLFRNAILDLAQRHEWARAWVNVGRLSVASCYEASGLSRERGRFLSSTARPGAAARAAIQAVLDYRIQP